MCENENKMCINITAEDYFNELKLMQQQFGQEEDLYPWIYMLLQMAECRKKEKAGKENTSPYNPISMRFVASASKAESDEGRKLIKGVAGFPDIAIFDLLFNNSESSDNKDKILGCVEAKKLGKLIKNLPENISSIKVYFEQESCSKVRLGKYNPKRITPLYYARIGDKKITDVKVNGKNISGFENWTKIGEGNPKEIELYLNDKEFFKLEKFKRSNAKKVCEDIVMSTILDEIGKEILCVKIINENISKIELKKEGADETFVFKIYKHDIDESCKAVLQLFGELIWYGKVLYTDGLIWKFLKVTKCENNDKDVHNIIDLRNYLYKNCIEGKNEWYKVLSGEGWNIEIECKTIADFTNDFNSYNGEITEKILKNWNAFTGKLSKIEWTDNREVNT